MSELAFNLNGEPFELPSAAVGWRVRKAAGCSGSARPRSGRVVGAC